MHTHTQTQTQTHTHTHTHIYIYREREREVFNFLFIFLEITCQALRFIDVYEPPKKLSEQEQVEQLLNMAKEEGDTFSALVIPLDIHRDRCII